MPNKNPGGLAATRDCGKGMPGADLSGRDACSLRRRGAHRGCPLHGYRLSSIRTIPSAPELHRILPCGSRAWPTPYRRSGISPCPESLRMYSIVSSVYSRDKIASRDVIREIGKQIDRPTAVDLLPNLFTFRLIRRGQLRQLWMVRGSARYGHIPTCLYPEPLCIE
jgi:hypothetical protein